MNQKIVFQPFVKFVIEFHNDVMLYGNALKNEFPKIQTLQTEEIWLLEESYLVKIAGEWESFIHSIISYCICMETDEISKHLGLKLPKKVSFDNAYSILNGLEYKTITSSSELRSLAKKVLSDQFNPFLQFEKSTLNHIDDLYALRNYVAHKSQRSKDRLLTMYKNRYNQSDFISPGKFLLQSKKTMPKIHNRDLLYGTLMMISVEIWKFLDINSYSFVYEDDKTEHGMLMGLYKMQTVFDYFTKNDIVE